MTMSSRQGRAGGLENEDTLSGLAARFGVRWTPKAGQPE